MRPGATNSLCEDGVCTTRFDSCLAMLSIAMHQRCPNRRRVGGLTGMGPMKKRLEVRYKCSGVACCYND